MFARRVRRKLYINKSEKNLLTHLGSNVSQSFTSCMTLYLFCLRVFAFQMWIILAGLLRRLNSTNKVKPSQGLLICGNYFCILDLVGYIFV